MPRPRQAGAAAGAAPAEASALSARDAHPHPDAVGLKMHKLRVHELAREQRRRDGGDGRAPSRPAGAKRARRELRFASHPGSADPWRAGRVRDRASSRDLQGAAAGSASGNNDRGTLLRILNAHEPLSAAPTDRDAFRSASLACEMVFREAKNALELQQDDSTVRRPNTQFITICIRVLGELAPTCGASRRLVTELREEFARHIYADFAQPAPGQTALCQQPYFDIVDSYKAQVEELLDENARSRKQIAQEIAKRRDTELVLQRLSAQLTERDRTLQDTRETLARLVHSTEASRDNYNRMRQDHEEIARELQTVLKAKEEAEVSAQQQIQIYQIRLTQVSADLNKALQELKQKNEEINRLKVQR